MKLTKKERLEFSYLLRILERLYPEEQDYYSQHRKAIEEGYELHYSWLAEHLYDGLSTEECQEVLDILDMYRGIIYSYRALKNPIKINQNNIAFKGFDGNHETSHMSYVEYFIDDLGRYDEIKESCNGYYNSHIPTLDRYKRMLVKWNSLNGDRYSMDENTILELIDL